MVTDAAEKQGWCNQAGWTYPLEDMFTKHGKRLIVKFDISGRVIGGEFMVAGGEPNDLSNRVDVLGVIEHE